MNIIGTGVEYTGMVFCIRAMKAAGTTLSKDAILSAIVVRSRLILHHGLYGDEVSARH